MIFSITTFSILVSFIVVILSLYFKRSIPFFISLVVLIWQPFYFTDFNISIVQFHLSLSIFVPILFLCIGLQAEKGVFNSSGLVKFAICVLIVLVSYYCSLSMPLMAKLATTNLIFSKILLFNPLNELSFIFFWVGLVVFIINFFIKKDLANLVLIFSYISVMIPFLFSLRISLMLYFFIFSVGLLGFGVLRQIYKMAFIDTLTQVPSRRSLEEYIKAVNGKFTIAMADIDFFKKINDTYGHEAGDEVLKAVASELKKIKGGGKVFRYGGEEFTIIFANKLCEDCEVFLESVRSAIGKKDFVIRSQNRTKGKKNQRGKSATNTKTIKVTLSMGVCDSKKAVNLQEAFSNADKALYKAKESGRNCLKSF